jgi:ABC-type transporter Mla subunit MlaD
MYTKKAELKAGIVVLVAAGALVALLFVATGESIFGANRYVHIRFTQGRVAPHEGDAVLMNGIEIGRIEEIQQRSEVRKGEKLTAEDEEILAKLEPGAPREVREIYVLAVAKLPAEQVVPVGTTAEVKTELTGARVLSFLPGHSLRDLTDEDTHKNPIPGREKPGFEDIGEKAAKLLESVGKIADQGSEVMAGVRDTIASLQAKIDAIDAVTINQNVLDATAAMRSALQKVDARVEEIALNLAAASQDVRKITGDGTAMVEAAKKDLAELGETLNRIAGRLDGLVVKAEPKVLAFLDDIQGLGKSFERLAAEFDGIGPDARGLIAAIGGSVDQIAKPLIDAAHNIADASEDVRAHPWKLLNKPDEDEIAHENLRAATYNYARAMRDMDLAAQSLHKILGRPDLADPAVKAAAQQALAEFQTSRDRYRDAERRFLDLLNARVPPGGRPR